MKAHKWSSLELSGLSIKYGIKANLTTPEEGPQHFIPVFDTREQAIAFENGDETHIFELEEVERGMGV